MSCNKKQPYIPDCPDYSKLEYKIEKAQECCEDAHEQIEGLDDTKANEADVERSVQALNGKIDDNRTEIERVEDRIDNLVFNAGEARDTLWTGQASEVNDTISLGSLPTITETLSLSVSAGSTGLVSLAHSPKVGTTVDVTFYCLDYVQTYPPERSIYFTAGTPMTFNARDVFSLTVGQYTVTYDGDKTISIDGTGVASSYKPLEVHQAEYTFEYEFLEIYYRAGLYAQRSLRVPATAIGEYTDLVASDHANVSPTNPNFLNYKTRLRKTSDTEFTINVAEEYIIENATGLVAEILDVAGIIITRIDGITKTANSSSGTEVIDARTGADGTIYPTLKDRLDAEYEDFDALGLSVVDGAINVTYTV